MLESMLLESINVGASETIAHGEKSFLTGIRKIPVSGPVLVDQAGVAEDAIINSQHHGGVDQAVYAYSADDYEWWSEQLDHALLPGRFGENLTIRGLPSDMNVGDRLLIGEVVLEATAPRIPCATFAAEMQDSAFGMAFREAERPGVYFRVLNSGEITAGDSVTFVANNSGDVSVIDLFRFNYALHHDPATLRKYLDAPVAYRFRAKIESRLLAAEKPTA